MRFARSLSLVALPALAAAAAVAQAPAPGAAEKVPAVLAALRPGAWHLRMIDGVSGTAADVCVADVRQLVQLRHGAAQCARFVATDQAEATTISYACPGAGSGRTTLRLLPQAALRIDSQGVADKAPFAFVAEARRTGECAAAAPAPAAATQPAAAPAAR